jgi:hypothetical protein
MPPHNRANRPVILRQVTSPEEPSPRPMTTGQIWKSRRDLIILLASRQGASQRLLGDVFDLPHSRINVILKKHRAKYPGLCGAGAGGAAQIP